MFKLNCYKKVCIYQLESLQFVQLRKILRVESINKMLVMQIKNIEENMGALRFNSLTSGMDATADLSISQNFMTMKSGAQSKADRQKSMNEIVMHDNFGDDSIKSGSFMDNNEEYRTKTQHIKISE